MSLETMKSRLQYYGGKSQQDRMIKDKLKSMESAIGRSYQSAIFKKYPDLNEEYKGLFNPVTQTLTYDTKLISINYNSGYKIGDIFLWKDTGTYWICYSQDLTELAYFRGSCRRCNHKVRWVNGDKEVLETYISVVGPTQPDFRTYEPGFSISVDSITADLVVLTSDNEQNKKYFNQYQRFVLNGFTYKIHQIDTLSLPGIIKMYCVQVESNLIEDDVEENLSNKWNIQPIIPEHPTSYGIDGPTTIKPLFPYSFESVYDGIWFILENKDIQSSKFKLPLKAANDEWAKHRIVLTWDSPKSGGFTLCYEMKNGTVFKKYVVVESLM